MKKHKMRLGTLVGVIFLCLNSAFATSDPIGDHTLIDCINGDNSTGVAFDSGQPYQTLKAGIEATTAYISSNINKAGNEATASGMVMNIKVNCSIKDVLNPQIELNFLGKQYNNELIIEGAQEDALIIDDMYFYIYNNTGYITFKNAKFVNNILKPYYFTGEQNKYYNRYSWNNRFNVLSYYSINIGDSYIHLQSNSQIGEQGSYISNKHNGCGLWSCRDTDHTLPLYMNYLNIQNSQVDIDIENDYNFNTPKIIEDSLLTFSNNNFAITLNEKGISQASSDLSFSALISNEIDFGDNTFLAENTDTLFFINNKFSSFSSFSGGTQALYINNLFENTESIEIGETKDMYNNIFTAGVTDSTDPGNLRRNFHIDNISSGGLGWVFKRINSDKYFNLDFSSSSLYKEITGNDLPGGLGEIYVIFTH